MLNKNYTSFIFCKLVECAKIYKFELFLVGGKVRDILIKNCQNFKNEKFKFLEKFSSFSVINYILENCENFDFDFTLFNENFYDALYFAEKFKDFLKNNMPEPEIFIKKNQSFLTVNISIKFKNYSILFDIATFRKEFYSFYGVLPDVIYSKNIKDDALRRDITINSIYIKLTNNIYIVDILGGIKDLNEKIIRLNYKFSLLDDPTRIIRIIKFKSRLNFRFSKETISELFFAKNKKIYTKVSNYRILAEIKKSFSENNKTIKNFLKNLLELDFISILTSKFSKKSFKKFCLDLKNFEKLKKEPLFLFFIKNLEKINDFNNKNLEKIANINVNTIKNTENLQNFNKITNFKEKNKNEKIYLDIKKDLWFFKFLIFLKNLQVNEIKNIGKKFPFNKNEKQIILKLYSVLKLNKSLDQRVNNKENLFKIFSKQIDKKDLIIFLIIFYNNKIFKEKILEFLKIS